MTSPPGLSPEAALSAQPAPRRRGLPGLPVMLMILAIADLRVDLLLLFDHFTLTTLTQAILSHPLAVAVLVAQPSLWRHYRGPRGRS